MLNVTMKNVGRSVAKNATTISQVSKHAKCRESGRLWESENIHERIARGVRRLPIRDTDILHGA
jgi:hypothetical protein